MVGLGTVGRWLLRVLDSQAERVAGRYDVRFVVTGVANAHDGFVFDDGGLDVPAVLGHLAAGRSITEHPGVEHWPSAIEGLRATEADVLVEVTASPRTDGEPGVLHMREALGRGIPVVTSNKWPIALRGLELAELASSQGVASTESTVMSGTPLLGPLTEGLAGAVPVGLRGIVNATANFMLSAMASGRSYDEALAAAQAAGLAERGVEADVKGSDAQAKTMILAALVFGRQLRPEEVACRGISGVARTEIEGAVSAGGRIRHVATLELSERDGVGDVRASVEPVFLSGANPLARIDGTENAVICRATPVGEITIVGPGAGLELAGQGVLSDLIAVARSL